MAPPNRDAAENNAGFPEHPLSMVPLQWSKTVSFLRGIGDNDVSGDNLAQGSSERDGFLPYTYPGKEHSRRRSRWSNWREYPWIRAPVMRCLIQVRRAYIVYKKSPILSLAFLVLLTVLGLTIGFATKYLLDPDKERMPWREFCNAQPEFVLADVAHLAPVNILVGVMSYDAAFSRRMVIRDTYARMTVPRHPETDVPLGNVAVKFILARPRKNLAHRIALEMEMYNDIVVLDMAETQKSTKTLNFFRWAAENGTMPVLVPAESSSLHPSVSLDGKYQVQYQLADYVLKADDDAFIVLDQLELRLRAAPRRMAFWGYLVRKQFMAGELYGLSQDLVQYIATSPNVARSRAGKEDSKMTEWIKMHPDAARIAWVAEMCWIYDHPRSWTPYAHGFLFPDHVRKIKDEFRAGISPQELARREGPYQARSYSTTSKWRVAYQPPQPDLSVEESVEALIEGGGRWKGHWYRSPHDLDSQQWYMYSDAVFSANDARLFADRSEPHLNNAFDFEPNYGLASYHHLASPVPKGKFVHITNPYGANYDPFTTSLRNARYLDNAVGRTVAVHYVKKDEWLWETALALLGRDQAWEHASGGAGRAWRMYGSPIVDTSSVSRLSIHLGRRP
ncbi:hypothetical protein MVES_000271 [Malassezia vespertilionis]|uniref:Hexosyltransferase n=2 Tax=Malassezia vespertilionis TaxID=2020962 RepID=A0A2N1JGH1_9BASI|nr:hypothetical protein MVES_000271 [Malassezia vespertilionis]